MTSDDEDDLVRFADALQRVARALEPRRVEAGVVELTGTEATVLRWIDHHPNASASAVADGVGLRRSNTSAVLRSLSAHGLIERVRRADDARVVTIVLTEHAHEEIARLRTAWRARLSRVLTAGDEVLVADAAALLERIDEALQQDAGAQDT